MLSRVAVRRGGTGCFRVTDHQVRVALSQRRGGPAEERALRLVGPHGTAVVRAAAVRALAVGVAGSAADAGRARVAESSELVRDGSPAVSGLDRWPAGLAPAGRAAVGAAAVTWATRLWCALDWDAFAAAPVNRTRPLVEQPRLGAAGAAGSGGGAERRRESGRVVGPPA